jgi:hypothetical protein
MPPLTTAQVQELASIVLEEFGSSPPPDDELTHEIVLLHEDIVGFETAPNRLFRRVRTQLGGVDTAGYGPQGGVPSVVH